MGRKTRKRSNGAGYVRPPVNPGGRWSIQYMEGSKRRFRGGFPTKEAAELQLQKLTFQRASVEMGVQIEPPNVPSKGKTISQLAKPWLAERETVAVYEDRLRWKNHIEPFFGHLLPQAVTTATVETFVRAKRKELEPGTIRVSVSLLRQLFRYLVDTRQATANPCLSLPREVQRLYKPNTDPTTTPFIEKLGDVSRIYGNLPEPLNIAYALGALAGLRTGEVLGLDWEHVDLKGRTIHIRQQIGVRKGQPFKQVKDKESRIVPVLDALLPVLKAWKTKSGGKGLVVPSLRSDGIHVNKKTVGPALAATLKDLGLSKPGLGWYEATRHTFASHWVMNGGTLEKLKELLGHYSVTVTERHYVHLLPGRFSDKDYGALPITLGSPRQGD